MRSFTTFSAFVLCCMASPALSEPLVSRGRVELSLSGTIDGRTERSDRNRDDWTIRWYTELTVAGGYFITDHLEAGLSFGYVGDFVDSSAHSYAVFGAVHLPLETTSVVPFLGGQVGTTVNPPVGNDEPVSATVFGGVKVFATRNLAVVVQLYYRDVYARSGSEITRDESLRGMQWGLSGFFR